MIRRCVASIAGLLALFHVWLLLGQLQDGRLADPGLVLRWLVAAGLMGGLVGVRRRGESIVRGRKAVSIWLLSALLHGPAMADANTGQFSLPATPAAVTTVLQFLTASVTLGLSLALAGAALGTIAARRWRWVYATIPGRALRVPYPSPRFAPRPPPAHS
jgi:hypothetical protein